MLHNVTYKRITPYLVLLAGVFQSGYSSSADAPEKALQDAIAVQEKSTQASARSQQTLNKLSEQEQVEVEDDYGICVKRGSDGEDKMKGRKKS